MIENFIKNLFFCGAFSRDIPRVKDSLRIVSRRFFFLFCSTFVDGTMNKVSPRVRSAFTPVQDTSSSLSRRLWHTERWHTVCTYKMNELGAWKEVSRE